MARHVDGEQRKGGTVMEILNIVVIVITVLVAIFTVTFVMCLLTCGKRDDAKIEDLEKELLLRHSRRVNK
jgi:hypothetical protein